MFCCRPGSVVQAVVDSWLTLARRPWHQCLCLWKSSTAKTVAVIMSHSQRNFIAVGSMTDAWEALAYIQSMNKQAPEGPHILWWHSEAPGPAKGLIWSTGSINTGVKEDSWNLLVVHGFWMVLNCLPWPLLGSEWGVAWMLMPLLLIPWPWCHPAFLRPPRESLHFN